MSKSEIIRQVINELELPNQEQGGVNNEYIIIKMVIL